MKFLFSLLLLGFFVTNLFAHCQVPCGIYDDAKAFKTLMEHAHTIERAVENINDNASSFHQKVRWIQNKEKHATDIQDLVNHYFLVQRIKANKKSTSFKGRKENKHYLNLLKSSHKVLVWAMKNKQEHDQNTVLALKNSIQTLQDTYNKK